MSTAERSPSKVPSLYAMDSDDEGLLSNFSDNDMLDSNYSDIEVFSNGSESESDLLNEHGQRKNRRGRGHSLDSMFDFTAPSRHLKKKWLQLIHGAVPIALNEGIEEMSEQVSSKVRRGKRKLVDNREKSMWFVRKVITGDQGVSVRDHVLRNPSGIRSRHRWSFTIGIIIWAFTEYMLLTFPEQFWLWYVVVMSSALTARAYYYMRLKYTYFLADFCYFVQAMFLVNIILMRLLIADSTSDDDILNTKAWVRLLCQINFCLANGPLLFAILAWRNSLVWHSIDKVTSMFIHSFPALLAYCWRWSGPGVTVISAPSPVSSKPVMSLYVSFIPPLFFYAIWQALYIIKIEFLDSVRLAADPKLETSYRWFVKDTKNSLHQFTLRMLRRAGLMDADEIFSPSSFKTKSVFIASQLIYTVITLVPCKFMYDHHSVHVAILLIILAMSVHNGSGYYFNVFSNRYTSELERRSGDVARSTSVSKPSINESSESESKQLQCSETTTKED